MAMKMSQGGIGATRQPGIKWKNPAEISIPHGSTAAQYALNKLIHAFLEKDLATISRLVAKGHIGITSRGCTFSSRELEKKVMEMEIRKYEISNLSSHRVANNEVLILFDAQIQASWNGLHDAGWFNVISLWVKGVVGWQEVFYQETQKKD